jgi:hypothetical protein
MRPDDLRRNPVVTDRSVGSRGRALSALGDGSTSEVRETYGSRVIHENVGLQGC